MSQELQVIEKETNDVVNNANSFRVATQEEYDAGNVFLRTVKDLQKKVKETFSPIVKKAHEAHKEAKAQEKKHLDPLIEAEKIVKQKSLVWLEEQENIRLEKEKKEREKAEAEEKKRKEELERQAKNWEEKGNVEKAEERREQAEEVYIPPAPVESTATKAAGQSIKVTWSAEVVDLMALVKGVVAGTVPLACIEANMPVLNKQAVALKEQFNYPGVKAVSKKGLAIR
jgi:hypothetical protein